jgi:phosphoenolpyruvate carboxykinase (ATP)
MNNDIQSQLYKLGISDVDIHWNLSPEKLASLSVDLEQAKPTSFGTITVNTGEFTGRSPKDRFIVKDDLTTDSVWWGDVNIPFSPDKYTSLYNKVVDYIKNKDIYVRDVYACADENFRLNIRVINEYPWSNLFAYNMFLRPSEEELKTFTPEWTIINIPSFLADAEVDGT